MDLNNLQRLPRSAKNQTRDRKGKRKNNSSLKVVYISSPMKVKTSASRFRSLVQELTGKNSDISQYMAEPNNHYGFMDFREIDCDDDQSLAKDTSDDQCQIFSSVFAEDTPTSSDSLLEPMENVFVSQMDEQFSGFFSTNSFFDASQLDVLGSYDELL
ncbi:hypothetical protein Salat_1676300 [Sesamum alatum]|uniref:VQ domain-containing protein n=1 Tax=Sesamum alatum TaxID=300844 RepID=A0AAE1Y7K7_9LAMI|nr:hypothetical protein Salat_1676300 [Sesamum alatum]